MPLLWKWQLQPKMKWKCSSFYWQVLTRFSVWWLLSSSQTKPTHSCHIHQILLFSAFQYILFCLRLFKGFPSWIFFLFHLLFLSFQLVSLVGFLLLSFGFQHLVLVFIWKDQSLLTYHSLQEEVKYSSGYKCYFHWPCTPNVFLYTCAVFSSGTCRCDRVGRRNSCWPVASAGPQLLSEEGIKHEGTDPQKALRCFTPIYTELPPTVHVLRSIDVTKRCHRGTKSEFPRSRATGTGQMASLVEDGEGAGSYPGTP